MTTSVTGDPPPHAAPHGEHHPTALPTLFFAEVWERFSCYGMRSPCTVLIPPWCISRRSPGNLADRFLGYRKAILIGGLVMAMSHFAMAFPVLM